MQPTNGVLEIDGVRLECRWIGSPTPDRPTLVFLHEGLGCVALWKNFPDRLAARTGLATFAYSRAGYGGSDPVSLPRRVTYLDREARDVLPKVLAAAGIGRTILIGHSDGGTIALIYAANGGNCAAAVVTIAAHVFNEDAAIRGIETVRDAYRGGDLRARLARSHARNVDCAFRGWSEVWLSEAFRSWSIVETLSRVTVPTLAIQGRDDPYGTLAQVHAICRGVSGRSREAILAACGHAPHREKPAETIETVARFLAEFGAPSGEGTRR